MTAKSRWDLRGRRLAAGISLAAVASRFGRGVTRERIRQIEASPRVRPETRAVYEAALSKAVEEREAVTKLIAVLSE